ncbi:hypothetical protein LguiA_000304 [Lonicera macranthoides]
MSAQKRPQSDLKHRVITCLNKLSDRDTLAVATTELESIAKTLTHESFSPFLTCLSTTDSSEKSPVRKQCVRLLGLLSAEHRDALSPHLSKMLSAVIRRLRDPDSAVRSACIDSVSSMASHITKPPFSLFIKPLVEAVFLEQDYNAQIGSAMCLAAAIDSSRDPEPVQLQKLLQRLSKLVKNDSFKAKPALLSLIGSIGSAGGASNRNVLNYLIPCLVEFLRSEDWAARKAAAEALARLALKERNLLTEFKSSCLASLESRRFDKVKLVRETMNRALELWKEVPGDSEEAQPLSQSNSSSKGSANGRCFPTVAKGSHDVGLATPQPKKTISTSRSPPSVGSSTFEKRNPLKSSHRKSSVPMSNKVDSKKPSDWTIEIAAPRAPTSILACKDSVRSRNFVLPDFAESESCSDLNPETKCVLFDNVCAEKSYKFAGSRFGSRVVPYHGNDNYELDLADSNAMEDVYVSQKEVENLSLIQKQLLQIENQQSSLLNLLQRFIGSSQSGITSLETRVNGLEKALDEISYDLALSTGNINPNTEFAGNTCCMLPGTEFLSPKYWRRTEGQYSSSRFSFSGRNQSLAAAQNMPAKNGNGQMFKVHSPRGQQHSGVTRKDSRGSLESFSNKTPRKLVKDADMVQDSNAGVLDGTTFGNHTRQQT